MNLPRIFLLFVLCLVSIMGLAVWKKKAASVAVVEKVETSGPIEVELGDEIVLVESTPTRVEPPLPTIEMSTSHSLPLPKEEQPVVRTHPLPADQLPVADRIDEFFRTRGTKLPIVKTMTYRSRVDWLKGRPAWLTDYSSEFKTSRHFIARSLNNKPDYFKQDLSEGVQFNVLHPEKEIQFYLLVDTSRCKMWFYYFDKEEKGPVLVKTYDVGLGRPDPTQESGLLTPLGRYQLGDKIAVYKPGTIGHHQGQKIPMIQIFGTRWIPFERELENCTAPSKGLGIHGSPALTQEGAEIVFDEASVGAYQSDGCIRLRTEDIEEIFAIVISRPTVVEIVRDFHEATFRQIGG